MIDFEIINGTIREFENKELTFTNLQKLAILYTVRNNLTLQKSAPATPEDVPSISKSEFILVCQNANREALWRTLDELMQAIKILYPKMYTAVINDIQKTST